MKKLLLILLCFPMLIISIIAQITLIQFLKINELEKNKYNYKGAILSLLFIIPIGLYTKFYSGLSSDWINHSLGGVFYEIFWCTLFSAFFTNIHPIRISLFVLGFTCILEFLQLSDFSLLQFVRSYFIGRILIGTSLLLGQTFYTISLVAEQAGSGLHN